MESQSFDDYIVVGAGSAGSVLANRLSANPKFQVLVLEAGRESHPWSRIPVGFAKLINNPAANWLYSSEPDEGSRQSPHSNSARQTARRLLVDQRHGVRARAGAGLRPVGATRQPRLELSRRAADLPRHGKLPGQRGRGISRPQWSAQGHRKQRDRPALRRADQGRGPGRDRIHQRLQRCEAGRHRHDADDDPRRPPDEHGALLSRSCTQPAEPDHPGQCIDRMPVARRQALRRCALYRQRPAARGARQPRSGGQRRLDQFAAAAGIVRHRPARSCCEASASRCATSCVVLARICATTIRRG